MEFAVRVAVGGLASAVVCALVWALFFTFAFPWSGHAAYTQAAFTLGAVPGIVLGQKGITW